MSRVAWVPDPGSGPDALDQRWREAYGDNYEERIWDGRGLAVNDARQAGPEDERDSEASNAYQDRVEAGLEPEAEL